MTVTCYIAGLGRSGSTLLELMLATHEGVETAGELQVWPHELVHPHGVISCGCGLAVPLCPFWRGVRTRVDPLRQLPPRLDHFREAHEWGYTSRPKVFPQFLGWPGSSEEVRRYSENSRQVIEAVADQYAAERGARPSVIVDSSKDPYRALWLARSGQIDMRLIHLVRDPRATVHSLSRVAPQGERPELTVVRRAAAWNLENVLIAMVRRHLPPECSMRLRYEDMVRDPDGTLGVVSAMCGVPQRAGVAAAMLEVEVHSIAGNPMRRSRRPVALDESWRTGMAPGRRILVSAITLPLRSRFGYPTSRANTGDPQEMGRDAVT